MTERILPNSLEAERTVLGAAMLDPNNAGALILQQLSSDDLYYGGHQTIYKAVENLIESRQPVDLMTVTQYLADHNQLDEIGGPATLSDMIGAVPTTQHVHYYIGIVREKSLLRRCVDLGHRMTEGVYQPIEDVAAWVTDRAEEMDNLRQLGKVRRGAQPASEHRVAVEQAIADRIAKLSTGLETGWRSLDKLLCGLKPQSLTVLAARPSRGKTAFAVNLAAHLARQGIGVLFFSLEQSARQLLLRMVAAESRQNLYNIQNHSALTQAVEIVHGWPVWLDERGGIKASVITSEARRVCRLQEMGLVIIDRLELIAGTTGKQSLFESTTVNSGLVKDMAKELNLPVILICQLNRKSESEQRLARLDDLRQSGAIEENATSVVLLNDDLDHDDLPEYAREAYGTGANLDDLVLVDVVKNQDGPTGQILLQFHRQYTRFDSVRLEAE